MPADERKRIIRNREAIARALHETMVGVLRGTTTKADIEELATRLAGKYGSDQVQFVMAAIQRRRERAHARDHLSAKQEERQLYAEYVERHQKHGGTSKRLTEHEFHAVHKEHSQLTTREVVGIELQPYDRKRMRKLETILLYNCDLWE